MSSQILRAKIKSFGVIPSADSIAGLQKQLAQIEQSSVSVEPKESEQERWDRMFGSPKVNPPAEETDE